MALEKHDVGRDISKRVLAKGCIRQADSAEQVGLSRDMLTGCGIDGIHEIAADHERGHAAFPEEADGLGQKVVVNGEFPQFWEVGIVERLLAERRITDNQIEMRSIEANALKAGVVMPGLRIQVLRDG